MSSSPNKVLSDKDVNAPMADHSNNQQETYAQQQQLSGGGDAKDVKSMEYHRQVFQNKMTEDKYVAPLPK